jgi:hypothetical protein
LEAKLSFQAAVAEEMRVDDAVGGGQAQTRDQEVLELFPHLFGVGFFGRHGSVQRKNWFLASAQNEEKTHPQRRRVGHPIQAVEGKECKRKRRATDGDYIKKAPTPVGA